MIRSAGGLARSQARASVTVCPTRRRVNSRRACWATGLSRLASESGGMGCQSVQNGGDHRASYRRGARGPNGFASGSRARPPVGPYARASVGAGEDKVIDGGKAKDFKGKTFALKEKGKAKISLTFPAKGTFVLTIKSKKESDVNLFVYDEDNKEVAKDDSPGPSCEIKFTPTK